MTPLVELREPDAPLHIIGLMSGTSADGIDAAVCRFRGCGRDTEWALLGWTTVPFTAAERERILAAQHATAAECSALHFWLGERFAAAADAGAQAAGLTLAECHAIGSHGQTVYHGTATDPADRHTLQLGAPAVIAERTGLPVVSDFRTRDIAAGGQGAPLMPYADAVLFGREDATRWLLNIGGIANVTVLPPGEQPTVGWDTGPGNVLIDAAVAAATNGAQRFDEGGALAGAGTVDEDLLASLLAHPYLGCPPPKSTGREMFGPALAEQVLQGIAGGALPDVVATLTAFTADSIAASLEQFAAPYGAPVDCLLSGGGAHNPVLRERLAARLAPVPLRDTADEGLPGDAKEAVGFALLANDTLHAHHNSCPSVTGARHAVVLGSITL